MTSIPTFRHRRPPNRTDYTLLENSDSERGSTGHRSFPSLQQDYRKHRHLLCDKCWVKRERSRATKYCLDCKQNLCTVCARCDEITRPWWLPSWLAQCWRFIFTKAFIPHSFMDLELEKSDQRPHWAHTQEASSIQRIPRVRESSLRSNKSNLSADSRQALLPESKQDASVKHSVSNHQRHNVHEENQVRRRLLHSQSVDGKAGKRNRSEDGRPRRTRSSEFVQHRQRLDDLERLKQYNDNWNKDFLYMTDEFNPRRKASHILKGKDVNIEFTDKEIKLSVNSYRDKPTRDNKTRKAGKCAVPKSKPMGKSSERHPKQHTEEIFEEVPTWLRKSSYTDFDQQNQKYFDRKSRQSTKTRSRSVDNKADFRSNAMFTENMRFKREPWETRHTDHRSHTPFSTNSHVQGGYSPRVNEEISTEKHADQDSRFSHTNTAYIVEEPPDSCPICLEDLPGPEARSLNCYHVIHTICLIKYVNKTDLDFEIRCPVCSQTTVIKNYYVPRNMWYKELPVFTGV